MVPAARAPVPASASSGITVSTAASARTVPVPPAIPNCRTLAISATPSAPKPTAVVATISTHAWPTVTSVRVAMVTVRIVAPAKTAARVKTVVRAVRAKTAPELIRGVKDNG